MHSPLYAYETEVRDRVDSYRWQAEARRQRLAARQGMGGSWLASLEARLRATARRVADAIGSSPAKPSEPAEQCC